MVGHTSGRLLVQLTLAVCAALSGGCTCLPRIDPSGERCFIWPNQQQQQLQQDVLPPSMGNRTAPPVVTDPIFPAPQVVTPNVVPGASAPVVPTVPFETLSMTPDRVLAPVGSEVILKTGICTRENFLLTCQKIDWLVAREGTGQLVAVGGRGWCADPVLPWNKGKKVDNNYGIGYTAHVDYTIDRGTEDTSDDVEIVSGQGWASFTSPVEGTTHVTAVAKAVTGWPERRAIGTIYWVDVQWEFPPVQISSSGSQVLSTIVRRQTDGTPLPGWVVRYEVLEGGGILTGGASNQVIEVVTGADGRASVEVTPVGGSGNTTQVALQLVRPAEVMPGNMPRLVIANGASTITWNGGNSYLPPADNLGTTIPTQPIPGIGDSTQPAIPITPAPTQPSTLPKPVLDIEIHGNDTGKLGGEARFEVIIRNTGDAEATGLVINDRFDAGLRHPGDNLGTRTIDKRLSATIPPGQSHTEYITFEIVTAGNLCHDVSVRSAQGAEAAKRACINVPLPDVAQMPGMEVRKDGPRLSTVGETVLFTLSVKNTGAVPLNNVEVLDEYDAALAPRPRTEGYIAQPSSDGRAHFIWRIPRLEVGAVQRFEVDCTCKMPKQRACSIASVTAQGGADIGLVPSADEHCMEIVESRTPGAGGATDVVPPIGGGTGGLRLSISPYNLKPIVGSRATYQFYLENGSNTPDEQVQLRVAFPPELVPDMATVQADVGAQLVGNELQFNPVAMIRPNERLSFTVTASVLRAGIVNVTANAVSAKFPSGIQKSTQVEVVGF
jgi:uncharacterized repeat protein (TIGR01451 family)